MMPAFLSRFVSSETSISNNSVIFCSFASSTNILKASSACSIFMFRSFGRFCDGKASSSILFKFTSELSILRKVFFKVLLRSFLNGHCYDWFCKSQKRYHFSMHWLGKTPNLRAIFSQLIALSAVESLFDNTR